MLFLTLLKKTLFCVRDTINIQDNLLKLSELINRDLDFCRPDTHLLDFLMNWQRFYSCLRCIYKKNLAAKCFFILCYSFRFNYRRMLFAWKFMSIFISLSCPWTVHTLATMGHMWEKNTSMHSHWPNQKTGIMKYFTNIREKKGYIANFISNPIYIFFHEIKGLFCWVFYFNQKKKPVATMVAESIVKWKTTSGFILSLNIFLPALKHKSGKYKIQKIKCI